MAEESKTMTAKPPAFIRFSASAKLDVDLSIFQKPMPSPSESASSSLEQIADEFDSFSEDDIEANMTDEQKYPVPDYNQFANYSHMNMMGGFDLMKPMNLFENWGEVPEDSWQCCKCHKYTPNSEPDICGTCRFDRSTLEKETDWECPNCDQEGNPLDDPICKKCGQENAVVKDMNEPDDGIEPDLLQEFADIEEANKDEPDSSDEEHEDIDILDIGDLTDDDEEEDEQERWRRLDEQQQMRNMQYFDMDGTGRGGFMMPCTFSHVPPHPKIKEGPLPPIPDPPEEDEEEIAKATEPTLEELGIGSEDDELPEIPGLEDCNEDDDDELPEVPGTEEFMKNFEKELEEEPDPLDEMSPPPSDDELLGDEPLNINIPGFENDEELNKILNSKSNGSGEPKHVPPRANPNPNPNPSPNPKPQPAFNPAMEEDWECDHCCNINDPKEYVCDNCGAFNEERAKMFR